MSAHAHAPKVMALEAYRDDLLSEAGRARVERHLTRCAVCSEQLEIMDHYAVLTAEAAALEPPTLNWDRVEARLDEALDRQARELSGARRGKVRRLVWPSLAVAAAALLALILPGRDSGEEKRSAARSVAPAAAPEREEAPRVEGWVTLAANDVTTASAAGGPSPARPGSPVHEGMSLRTGPESELHVRLAADTGVVVWPDSEVRVERLRRGQVRLRLLRGTLSNTVRKLAPQERYEVVSGAYRAQVRGTRFGVRQAGGVVGVAVHEGRVEVTRGQERVALLDAGGSWTARQGEEAVPDRAPHAIDARSESWPTVALPALPEVRAWTLGGQTYSAAGALEMRQPPGPLELGFVDRAGTQHSLRVDVTADGARLDERTLRDTLGTGQPIQDGTLAPEAITPVVRRGIAQLRRCYERALRRDPRVQGRLRVRVRVGADGRVRGAKLKSRRPLPKDLERCVQGEIRGWRFPRPEGGPVSFEIPLNFQAKH